MSELSIKLNWKRKEEELSPGKFSSEHEVSYNDHYMVKGDTAPDWGGSAENTNPEQALAASLSSCHMMTFLALSAKTKWPVLSYEDQAIAHLGKNDKKQMIVNKIDLHPKVSFDHGFEVSHEELEKMHDRAHRYCFIANTLDSGVEVNINI
ncbi:OsmC family protein [Candidatus Pseudothioglobus sp. Uisw_016]|uniref:OsmC family protein n=1 Tax=Candidatus Pseudothioglobus sp. Uisw_016 TaxID=3230995 RepID=UPI003A88AA36